MTSPLVSIIIPTFNRRLYLPCALGSAVKQDYENIEIFVVNDGGEDVSDIVNSFDDPRIIFINKEENRGKPHSLNLALAKATGKYVCYLDDDDIYYSNHVSTLVGVLESNPDYHVAYSDLYKVYCRILPDGSRQVLSKVVEVSRDFDRYFMFYFNHCLHVSLMHRRDLLEKTGLYNEDLSILVDWDIARRFAFFTDFYHVEDITAEFYSSLEDDDRISIKGRKDLGKYKKNVLAIRKTRPTKPWYKTKDLSIIFDTDEVCGNSINTIGQVVGHTFYPYILYIPMPAHRWAQINSNFANMINVDVAEQVSRLEKIDKALNECEGEYVVILPDGFSITDLWVEKATYALDNSCKNECFELEDSSEYCFAVAARKEDFIKARNQFPEYSLRDSLNAAGLTVKKLNEVASPFEFDSYIHLAIQKEEDGDWKKAIEIYEYLAKSSQNQLWIKTCIVNACFEAGYYNAAIKFSEELNNKRPTVNTLLRHAKICRKMNDYSGAIGLLKKAEQILEGKELIWM
ncbi:MAG: glycosyltransferase [Planctomycetes bacterium]|nr:glycosyltransferase [Planctomycetota bacterium]